MYLRHAQVQHLHYIWKGVICILLVYLSFLSSFILVCSYIGGSEFEGHFSLINEACSM